MMTHLYDLTLAVENVPDEYLNNNVSHDGEYFYPQGIERTFMSELYHQWRLIQDNNPDRYFNLILQTTIGKKIIPNDIVEFPDIVLHGGQYNLSRTKNNIVFVEIKMDTYDSNDILKLFNGLEHLKYHSAVYILPNLSRGAIKEFIKSNPSDFINKRVYWRQMFFLNREDGLLPFIELNN